MISRISSSFENRLMVVKCNPVTLLAAAGE